MRLVLLILAGLLLYSFWPFSDGHFNISDDTVDTIKQQINDLKEKTDFSSWNEKLANLESLFDSPDEEEAQQTPRSELHEPEKQKFSILNIEIGDNKEFVEQQLGDPKRSSQNEYGTMWHTYHENYQHFVMIAYDEADAVAGIYTNQDLLSSIYEIKHGAPRDSILELLGKPLTRIQKGLIFYQLQPNQGYDLYNVDHSYVSIFYDEHQNSTITAIQIISEELENKRSDFYTSQSNELKEGFEYQLFDLTNATRVEHGLSILEWDEKAKATARIHSSDMAQNNYFNHTNLVGQTPFDRMHENQILFSLAGENLAYGQSSSVFAHEGLMNSLGHRENILQADFRFLGVGVAFNSKEQPYYTQNFYSK